MCGGQVQIKYGRYDLTVQTRHCNQSRECYQYEQVRDKDIVNGCLLGDEETDSETRHDEGNGNSCDNPNDTLQVASIAECESMTSDVGQTKSFEGVSAPATPGDMMVASPR